MNDLQRWICAHTFTYGVCCYNIECMHTHIRTCIYIWHYGIQCLIISVPFQRFILFIRSVLHLLLFSAYFIFRYDIYMLLLLFPYYQEEKKIREESRKYRTCSQSNCYEHDHTYRIYALFLFLLWHRAQRDPYWTEVNKEWWHNMNGREDGMHKQVTSYESFVLNQTDRIFKSNKVEIYM